MQARACHLRVPGQDYAFRSNPGLDLILDDFQLSKSMYINTGQPCLGM